MCFSAPKIPKYEQKDPILPKQPLQQTQPASLQVGRVEGQDNSKLKANRGRKSLRIQLDNAGVQTTGGIGKAGGVQIGGA